MSGSGEWDNRMMESLKNFDLSSPEVKQQFGEFCVPLCHLLNVKSWNLTNQLCCTIFF